jgi:hypothetical protein
LISVDELRAAGALDVPAAWRKSLAVEAELPLFSQAMEEEDQMEAGPAADGEQPKAKKAPKELKGGLGGSGPLIQTPPSS